MATAIQIIAKIQFSIITLKFLNSQRKYSSNLSQIAGHPFCYFLYFSKSSIVLMIRLQLGHKA